MTLKCSSPFSQFISKRSSSSFLSQPLGLLNRLFDLLKRPDPRELVRSEPLKGTESR
jgi:hypothetical protein